MRVAVLWTKLSGYFNACLQALSEQSDDLFVSYGRPEANAPFDNKIFQWLDKSYSFLPTPDTDDLRAHLEDFKPTILLICGWHVPEYRKIALRYRSRIPRILCMDNQWWGRPRQYLGIATSPWYLRPRYDAAFVASPRAAQFARRLGFAPDHIFQGLYSADAALFDLVATVDRHHAKSFIQVSRLAPEKGIDTLVQAYLQYRATTTDPWDLTFCGTGPEAYRLEGIRGIRNIGFQQPDDVRQALATAACFILASRFEPWGVALHEAACAGLPIIATSVCGAAAGLVEDGINGFLVPPESPDDLTRAMIAVSTLSENRRRDFGAASHILSRQYSPQNLPIRSAAWPDISTFSFVSPDNSCARFY